MDNGPYADYAFYGSQYYGSTIPPGEFPRLAGRASEYIDYITSGHIEGAEHKIKLAVCAIAEEMYKQEQGGEVVMRTVGPWTEQYATTSGAGGSNSSVSSLSHKMYTLAMRYLADTGLMYRGC